MAVAVGALAGVSAPAALAQTRILNVSDDPTREFYRDYNGLFNAWWTAQGNAPVEVRQSHGGSGAQARAVFDGLDAQVVTLAMSADIDATPDGDYTLARMLRRLPSARDSVLMCGSCMEARGLTEGDMREGATRSAMDDLAEATLAADKVMVF